MYFDKDHLNYMIKNINKRKGTPYFMANEELADSMFPHIKNIFPEATITKIGIEQHITVTKRARNALIKGLKERRMEYEKTIMEIDRVINELV